MEKRNLLIAGNWKMHKTPKEATDTCEEILSLLKGVDIKDKEIMVSPSHTSLFAVGQTLKGSIIELGAQDMHFEEKGAYTGETSPLMLKACGCKYVIIGHSERRQFFHETDQLINKKISSAISSGLTPIFCIGETKEERKEKKTLNVLDKQVQNGLKGIPVSTGNELVIAYEPIWAIGTGETASTQQAEEVHFSIRKLIEKIYNKNVADKIKILYGGSVKSENASKLMSLENVDGALIGGASLKAEDFVGIIKA